RFDTQDGLPHNTITAITIDHLGFVWIGTPNGLVRYDGYQFQPLTQLFTAGSSTFIKSLYTDELGRVWVGTQQNLYVINAITLEPLPISFMPSQNYGIQFITGDQRGTVYATNELGVYHCSLSGMICELKPVLLNGSSVESDYVVYIAKPVNDQWIGFTYSNKLVRFNTTDGSWHALDTPKYVSETNLLDNGDGEFLYLTGDTIVARFDGVTNKFVTNAVIPKKKSTQSLGVANGRLYSWNPSTGSPVRMRINKDTNAALQNHARSLYCSENGNCWIGTLNGLYRYSNQRSVFHSFNTNQT